MNKKRLFLLTGLFLAFSLSGCGKKEDSAPAETASEQNETAISGYLIDNADQYVTLRTYQGMDVEHPVYEVSEEEVAMEVENSLYEQSEVLPVDRAAQSGDLLTVDLKATLEGEEEASIEEEDYTIELGYEEFGADFDAALEGTKAGDTKSISCSFDEDSWYEDWIGKTVQFEVTVKTVEEVSIPEYNEDFVKDQGYDSIEDYEAELKKTLEANYEEQSNLETRNNAVYAAMETTEFNGYPDKLYDSCAASIKDSYAAYAEAFGMSEEELYEAFGTTEEDLEEETLDTVNRRLFISAICQKENLSLTDSDYQNYLEEQYVLYGYESPEEYEESYGKETILWELYEELAASVLLEQANLYDAPVSTSDEDFEYVEEAEDAEELEGLEQEESESI